MKSKQIASFGQFLIVAVIIAMIMIVGAGRSEAQVYYYVATNGSDSNPGTLAAPFATIDHARAIVAALPHPLTSPVTVLDSGRDLFSE